MDSANPIPVVGPQSASIWQIGDLTAPPQVTIIVPARNEEANLERCLRSLVVQKGVSFEVIVVNDASTDRTRAIAESFTRARQCPFIGANESLADVRVLDAPQPLPEGWTGKTNALVAAERAAHGEWLLFTDADTEHLEGSLAAAVAEAPPPIRCRPAPLPSGASLVAATGIPSPGAATVRSSGTSAAACGSRGAQGDGYSPSANTPCAPPTTSQVRPSETV